MNWEMFYCPHRDCRWYGQPFTVGLLVQHGGSSGAPQARRNAWGEGGLALWDSVLWMTSRPSVMRDGGAGIGKRPCAAGHGAERAGGYSHGRRQARSGRAPLPHGHALLGAQRARQRMPTRRVVACRAHEGSASARCEDLLDDPIPFFTSDPLPAYQHALLTTYGAWYRQATRHRAGGGGEHARGVG